jgi:hypothetical protein
MNDQVRCSSQEPEVEQQQNNEIQFMNDFQYEDLADECSHISDDDDDDILSRQDLISLQQKSYKLLMNLI